MREGRPPPSAGSRERERWVDGERREKRGKSFFLLFFSLRPPPPAALSTTAPALFPLPSSLGSPGGLLSSTSLWEASERGRRSGSFPLSSKKISPSQPRGRKGRGSLPLSTSSQKTYSGTESGKWWRERETISPPPKTPPSLFRAPPPASESKLNSMAVVAGILPFPSSLLPEP